MANSPAAGSATKKGQQAACHWQEQIFTCMRACIEQQPVLLSLVILALDIPAVFSQGYAVTAHMMRPVEASRLTEYDAPCAVIG